MIAAQGTESATASILLGIALILFGLTGLFFRTRQEHLMERFPRLSTFPGFGKHSWVGGQIFGIICGFGLLVWSIGKLVQ